MPKHTYNKKLKPLARKLRNNSTPGEIRLWTEVLRARKFYGYQFNRQFPIDQFIVDFVCRKLKLIVELDGRYHDYQKQKDQRRDAKLQSLGYRVLRIPEYEVKTNLDNVLRTLESYLPEEDKSP